MESVEGVEELFLGSLLLRKELDVVNEQQIDRAKLVAKAGHFVVAQRIDHFVGKFFAGDIADGALRLALFYLVADGMHEMRLAHADTTVNEERVVGFRGAFGHRSEAARANWLPLPIAKASKV